MDTRAGSYDFNDLSDNDRELQRLKLQAEIAKPLETSILFDHGLQKGLSVLDIGCGPGFVTKTIAELAYPGKTMGLELNETLLQFAKKNHQAPALIFQEGNIYRIPLPDKSVDFTYCRFLFQHLENPAKALSEIWRILTPGGRSLIVDVDDSWLSMHPVNKTYDRIIELQQEYQRGMGGDRFIGRKIPLLMHEAGFERRKTTVTTVTSDQLGMAQFLELGTGYKTVFLKNQSADEISETSIIEMKQACLDGKHFGCVGIFATSASKPIS